MMTELATLLLVGWVTLSGARRGEIRGEEDDEDRQATDRKYGVRGLSCHSACRPRRGKQWGANCFPSFWSLLSSSFFPLAWDLGQL